LVVGGGPLNSENGYRRGEARNPHPGARRRGDRGRIEKEEEILRERKLRRTRRSVELRLQKLGGCSGTWHDSKVTHQESGRRVKADTARARMGESDGEETGGVSFRSVGYKEC
jgi:hypothetical protein